jgi:hypothetical protein
MNPMRIIGPTVENESQELLLGARDIPAAAIRANLTSVLKDLKTILTGVTEELGDGHLAHVDVALCIGIDGSVGLLGIGAKANASGGMTVRISFDRPSGAGEILK